MTPRREAIFLPVVFLTVVLASAVRPGAAVSVTPPSLAALLTSTALFALLLRSGVVAPSVLVNSTRSLLANLNGASVLLTAFAASAQLISAVVPESGVPALMTWAVLVALIVQAFVMAPDRTRMLRGLMVTFGAAFALKFIVLAALSAPAEGRFARALQLLFEGVTLGSVLQRPPHPVEGYLTFAAIALYLVSAALLPSATWRMVSVSTRQLTESGLPFPTRIGHQNDGDRQGETDQEKRSRRFRAPGLTGRRGRS